MKKKQNNMSRILFRNTLVVVSAFIIVLLFLITTCILAFETGMLFTGKEPRSSIMYSVLLIMVVLFVIAICIVCWKNYKIIKAIKSLEDVTEEVSRGNFKVEIEYTEDETINQFVRNFNNMVKELDSMETLKEDFISNVSHEFKTPLSVIKSYSKALSRDNLDKEIKKQYQEVLQNNIEKLTNLTSNILNLSKLENQEMVLDKKDFLLDEQIRQCIVSLQPSWSKKNIDFKLDLPSTTYHGSEELINQIWQNIIGNAIKFSHDNGEISISIIKSENDINVVIADNGVGMNEETCKKVFDKFYQGDTSHSGDGNGLGLALVSRIVKICDGDIKVESTLGKGTTFTVVLK